MFSRFLGWCGGKVILATLIQSLLLPWSVSHAQTVSVTVDANTLNQIGGEKQLERTKYFNHWGTHVIQGNTNLGDLATEIWHENGLNSATGRETWEFDSFIAENVPEDPSRPGYFDLEALRLFLRSGANGSLGTYNNYLNNHIRYESVREHENHVLVQSGRAASDWPNWLLDGTKLPVSHNGEAYAEFLNVYLEEVVYGTGPQIGGSQSQAYLPIAPENFYIEIMNEPSWELGPGGLDWNDVIEMHRTVTENVKGQNPQAQIGGASVGNANFASWNPYRWDYKKQLMDDMADPNDPWSAEFDFWTFHPYDSRRISSNGVVEHHIPESTGHLDGILDLFESYSHIKFGDPKRIAVTEYGTIQWSQYNGGDWSPYDRRLMQWDELTDVKKKMLVFLDRPDRIINATPFIAPQWWTSSSPTEPAGASNVFWDRNANGTWTETIAAGFFRMLNDLQGKYIDISSDNDEIQVAAFRDGSKLHIVLNNLSESNQTINLNALFNGASATEATLDRVFWNGTTGVHQDNLDVLGSWQNLVLTGEEAAKLTLTYPDPGTYSLATDRDTYYGDDTQTPINLPGSQSQAVNINAVTEDATSASVRVAISGRNNIWNESFSVVVNGQTLAVPAVGSNGFDEHDNALFSREIDVPLGYLNDGNNEVYVDFNSSGGDLVTATLIVTRSIGDFNGSDAFDGEDLSLLVKQFGGDPNSKFDLDESGSIDPNDVIYWAEQLRGITYMQGDFDIDGDIDSDDLVILETNYGSGTHYGQGDFDFDGDVDGIDFLSLQRALTIASTSPSLVSTVPEPSTIFMTMTVLVLCCKRVHRSGIHAPTRT